MKYTYAFRNDDKDIIPKTKFIDIEHEGTFNPDNIAWGKLIDFLIKDMSGHIIFEEVLAGWKIEEVFYNGEL